MKQKFSFAVIAHVDSGKTELCKRISEKFIKREQLLDNLDVEKNRGITVKLKQFHFTYLEKEFFFIDTPGHTEFSGEVERTLDVSDNIFLLIDLTKGIQSSTLFLVRKLSQTKKKVFVIYNKIDMIDRLKNINDINNELKCLGLKFSFVSISAKKHINLDSVFELFKHMVPMEKCKEQIRIFDISNTKFGYKCFFKTSKKIRTNQYIYFSSGLKCRVFSIGRSYNDEKNIDETDDIDLGYFIVKTKEPEKLSTGLVYDTITKNVTEKDNFLSSNMYFQIFPDEKENANFYISVKNMLLNDPTINSRVTHHKILGNGYMLGVKGKMHMEIIEERLRNEYNLNVIVSNAGFFFKTIDGEIIYNPKDYDAKKHKFLLEMFSQVNLSTYEKNISFIIDYLKKIRGEINSINKNKDPYTEVNFCIPIIEMNNDFLSSIKKITHGYFDIENTEKIIWKKTKVSKMDILINNEEIKGFSLLLPENNANVLSGILTNKVAKSLRSRNFDLKIQAKLNNKIIKTETLKALKNDVTSKCYGRDRTRRKKLWEKQKQGRLKQNLSFSHNLQASDFKSIFKFLNY